MSSAQRKAEGRKGGGIYMHLSVLFIAPEQDIGSRLEGKVTHVIPLDDCGRWDVRFALRDRRLHICVSNIGKSKKRDYLWTRRRVFKPLVACVIHFPPKVHCLCRFTERVERRHYTVEMMLERLFIIRSTVVRGTLGESEVASTSRRRGRRRRRRTGRVESSYHESARVFR